MHRKGTPGQITCDLAMTNGKGFIYGRCAAHEKAEILEEAAKQLQQLAASRGEFEWTINLHLEFLNTEPLTRVLWFIGILDNIARDEDLRADITLVWKISKDDVSIWNTATNTKDNIEKGREGNKKKRKGLKLHLEKVV